MTGDPESLARKTRVVTVAVEWSVGELDHRYDVGKPDGDVPELEADGSGDADRQQTR